MAGIENQNQLMFAAEFRQTTGIANDGVEARICKENLRQVTNSPIILGICIYPVLQLLLPLFVFRFTVHSWLWFEEEIKAGDKLV